VRIFLDANVLFSAAQTDGAVRKLITRLHESDHQLVADVHVWAEARRNLVARYPSALPALDALTETIEVSPLYGGDQGVGGLPIDDKDKPILAAAITLDCRALITGDRTHFGHLFGIAVQGVTIYSPALAARALLR
jgi:predicted nucleic acid-binding protein